MTSLPPRFWIRVLLLVCLTGWVALATLAAKGLPVAATRQTPQAAPTATDGFVGDDTCTACHEGEGKSLHASLHGKSQNARTPSAKPNQACETCHGPGKEHSETGDLTKIRRFNVLSPRDSSEIRTSCHNRDAHAYWRGSMHDARNLSCV